MKISHGIDDALNKEFNKLMEINNSVMIITFELEQFKFLIFLKKNREVDQDPSFNILLWDDGENELVKDNIQQALAIQELQEFLLEIIHKMTCPINFKTSALDFCLNILTM